MSEKYENLLKDKMFIFEQDGLTGLISGLNFVSSSETLFGHVIVDDIVESFFIDFKEDNCGLLDSSKKYESHLYIVNKFKSSLKEEINSGFDKDGNLHIEKTYTLEKWK